jgi:hypothetical protein
LGATLADVPMSRQAGIIRPMMSIGCLLLVGYAQPANAATLSCAEAAAVAEAGAPVPPGLLLAIGNVESGRTDAMGTRAPWPWTINTGGTGRFFVTAEEAIFAVQAIRAAGIQSVDIGCFQINLFHHPNAFPDLASGFDPLSNALAATRLLVLLHQEFGAWEPAIAAYHSRVDMLGAAYRDQVLAVWHGAPFTGGIGIAGIHVWGPTGEIAFGSGRVLVRALQSRLPHVLTASAR